MDNSSK